MGQSTGACNFSEHIDFKGKEIRLQSESPGRFHLKITQEKFIDSLTGQSSKLSEEKAKAVIDTWLQLTLILHGLTLNLQANVVQ